MKKPLLLLAFGLCTAFSNADAATYNATPSGDGYQFSNSFSGSTTFEDYVLFSTDGLKSIVASVSGTGNTAFSFTGFNLLDADKNLISSGSVSNLNARIAFGGVESSQQSGNFYLQIIGSSEGATAGYNGTITTITAVPEPGTYALMLAGVGIIGLLRRTKQPALTATHSSQT